MHNVSNRPEKNQLFIREAPCYELGRVSVNPSFEKAKPLQDSFRKTSTLLKLLSKLSELPLQIRNLFLQSGDFAF
jgi:hypothetical protein